PPIERPTRDPPYPISRDAPRPAVLVRVVCGPAPGASARETQYGWFLGRFGSKSSFRKGNAHGRPHWRDHHLPCRHPVALSRQHAADRRPRQTDRARDRDHYRRDFAAEISCRVLTGRPLPPILALHGRHPRSCFRASSFCCVATSRPIAATARHEPLFTLI